MFGQYQDKIWNGPNVKNGKNDDLPDRPDMG